DIGHLIPKLAEIRCVGVHAQQFDERWQLECQQLCSLWSLQVGSCRAQPSLDDDPDEHLVEPWITFTGLKCFQEWTEALSRDKERFRTGAPGQLEHSIRMLRYARR